MVHCHRRSIFAAPRQSRCVAALLALAGGVAPVVETSRGAEPAPFVVGYDPFEIDPPSFEEPAGQSAVYEPLDPFDEPAPLVVPASSARVAGAHGLVVRPAQRVETATEPPVRDTVDPCAPAAEKPLAELTIDVSMPAGELPRDFAAECWQRIDAAAPIAAVRFWHPFGYHWEATALCHRPLYFEEINLERHGYGCHASLQPAVSAAHFFATVPALPYLMTVDCPHKCIYTLGHYRPGSCPPWRHHWPPWDPLAAAVQGGVLTGMIFLIP